MDTFVTPNMRRLVTVAVFVVLGMLVGALLTWRVMDVSRRFQPAPEASEITIEATTTETIALERSLPVHLSIPVSGVDTTFVEPLGVDASQEVQVPDNYEEVGWYKYGPTPGELGPAVILGHVDSYLGPAVFYSLGTLKEGDEIYVDREDGTTATFVVTHSERVPQSDFPTERVYGPIDFAGLRLVTCTGTYNRGIQRYSHNLIVYATLKTD